MPHSAHNTGQVARGGRWASRANHAHECMSVFVFGVIDYTVCQTPKGCSSTSVVSCMIARASSASAMSTTSLPRGSRSSLELHECVLLVQESDISQVHACAHSGVQIVDGVCRSDHQAIILASHHPDSLCQVTPHTRFQL